MNCRGVGLALVLFYCLAVSGFGFDGCFACFGLSGYLRWSGLMCAGVFWWFSGGSLPVRMVVVLFGCAVLTWCSAVTCFAWFGFWCGFCLGLPR